MTGVVRVCVELVVTVVLSSTLACTTGMSGRGTVSVPVEADGATAADRGDDSLAVFGDDPLEAASTAPDRGDDSLVVHGDELLEAASTAENQADAMTALGEDPLEAQVTPHLSADRGTPRKAARGNRVSGEAVGITGYRSELRANVRTREGVSAGLKADRSGRVGFLRLSRPGIVRSVHVGHLSVGMGQRLILGRRLGMYASSAAGPVRGGVAVAPSLSRWFGRTGVGVEVQMGRWTCHSVLIGSPDPDGRWHARSLWISVARSARRISTGVTVGEQIGGRIEPAGDLTGRRPAVVSGHAFVRWSGMDGSGEMVWFARGGTYFALRAARWGRPRYPRWSLLLFRAPYVSSTWNFLTDLDPGTRTFQGTRLDVSWRISRVRAALACLAGRIWSPSEKSAYRRVVVSAGDRGRDTVSWECSLVHSIRSYDRYATGALMLPSSLDEAKDLRFRVGFAVRDGTVFSTKIRFDYMPRFRGEGSGTLLLVGMGVRTERLDARLQIASHSLSRGRSAFIARPGVGSFELFSAVYGKGSDVSVRVQLHLTERITLFVYHGSSWSRLDRVYLGIRGRL